MQIKVGVLGSGKMGESVVQYLKKCPQGGSIMAYDIDWAFQLPRQVNMAAKATTNENRRCVMIETFGNKLRKLEIIAENSPGIDKRFSISREEFVARRPKWRR